MPKSNKRLYVNLLLIISIIATLPVIIVGLFSYLKSSDIIESNIAEEKLKSVYQIQENVEQVLQTVDFSVTNFITSYQFVRTLDEPLTAYQFQLYNQIKKEISLLQRFDGGVDDILLASYGQEWRINNNGLRRLEDGEKEEIIEKYSHLPYKSSWLVEQKEDVLFDSNAGSSCASFISLVKQLPLNISHKTGIAIAYIPICDFKDILTSKLESETIMVIDEYGNVVGHSDFSKIGKNLSSMPFLSELSSNTEDVGQYNVVQNDTDYKVTYRKSTYNNWTYISMIKISELNKQSRSIGWFTIIMSAIILIAVLITALIASKRLYAPINRLTEMFSNTFLNTEVGNSKLNELDVIENQIHHMLDQNHQLESKLQGQIVQLKQFFIARLIQGKLSNEEIQNRLTAFNYNLASEEYHVLVLRIDSIEDTKYNKDNEDVLLFTINTMIEDLIPEHERMTPIVVNLTQVTILFGKHTPEEEDVERLTGIIDLIITKVKQELDLSISIGVSESYSDLINVNQAFKEGQEALRYTLKFGPGSTIFFGNLQSESSIFTLYPRSIENDLFAAIKTGDKQKVDDLLDKLIQAIFDKKLNNTQYEIAIVRFLTNLIELTETLGVDVLDFEKHNSLYDQLYEFRTLPEVIKWFKYKIIHPMMAKADERTQLQYKNISDEIIHIVQQEFDSDLTLNYIADKLHYNANYLSSIFKKETNTSFSDYLSRFRIDMAKKWLEETDITVKEIAEKLNYNNSQNFIRSFRKIEGTTPGRYRDSKKH